MKNISMGWVLISIFFDRPYRRGWNKPVSSFPFGRFSGAAAVVHRKDTNPTIAIVIELFKDWREQGFTATQELLRQARGQKADLPPGGSFPRKGNPKKTYNPASCPSNLSQ